MELKAKTQQEFRKKQQKMKNKMPFNSKQQRFMKHAPRRVHQPGPGEYYDPSQTTWSKRTYNILFAEI